MRLIQSSLYIKYNMHSAFEPQEDKGQVTQQTVITNNELRSNSHPHTEEIPHDDSDQDERRVRSPISRNPYGNFLVLRKRSPHLSLGPDFCCFIPAFICFAIASYYIIVLVLASSESFVFHAITLFICIGQPLAYCLVAFSDPGVVTEQSPDQQEGEMKNCTKCIMAVPRHSRHCNDCGVCVSHYDHHCPWTSKCIGGGNIIRFYCFLGMTPIYLIYITIAFVVCMSNNLVKVQHLTKTL